MKSDGYLWLAVILCSSASILPALGESFTLNIYGNANLDEVIDENDVTYILDIINGDKSSTIFADVNLDGKVDQTDADLTEKIIKDEEETITLIDSANRTVTVNYPIEDMVSLSENSAEFIKILGAEDRLKGIVQNVADKTVFFPDLCKLPVVKSGSTTDYEKVLSMHPKVAFSYEYNAVEDAKKLEPHMTVIGLAFYKPKIMAQETAELGYLLGKEDEAYEFINFYESYLKDIAEKVDTIPDDEKVKVYFERNDFVTAGNSSGTNEMCLMAGGMNIAQSLEASSSPTVDQEWVIKENPDVMIKIVNHGNKYMGYEKDNKTNLVELRDSILNRTGAQNINAVKNDRLFIMSDSIMTKASYFVGVAYFAKIFYPDLFKDLDPENVHQEYLTRFQSLGYNLQEHGIFVYPEPA
jgi:iron complex transport system substrate-binding protein